MFNVVRAESDTPEGALEYDYILEVSKHDDVFLKKLEDMGWEQFGKKEVRHLEWQGKPEEDMFDTLWMGIKTRDLEES